MFNQKNSYFLSQFPRSIPFKNFGMKSMFRALGLEASFIVIDSKFNT